MRLPPRFAEYTALGLSFVLSRERWPRLLALAGTVVVLVAVIALGTLGLARAFGTGQPQPTPRAQGGQGALAGLVAQASSATPTPSATAVRPTPTAATTGNGCTITSTDVAAEQFLLGLLNKHRAAAGVGPLKLNTKLAVASRQHSCDMYQHQKMTHMSSDGTAPLQRLKATGVSFVYWAENIGIARGLGVDGGITQIDDGMMAEPLTPYEHHWNIIHAAFTQVGLGIIYINGQVWLTEDFID